MSSLSPTAYPLRSYTCTKGHEVSAHQELSTCPAYVKGKPCTGELRPA